MKELHLPLIETLPDKLDLPERFGDVALQLAEVVQLPLPEIARVYQFPPSPESQASTKA